MIKRRGRSKASSPFALICSGKGKIWIYVFMSLVSLYPFVLWTVRTPVARPPATTTSLRHEGDGNADLPVNKLADSKYRSDKPIIGYAVSITGCGSESLIEG